MTTGAILFWGILSAYALNPSKGTLEYRQAHGQLPMDVSGYEFFIAVDDCGLIGHEATLYAGELTFDGVVYDCAGADGVMYFSDGDDLTTPFKLAGDIDYWFWKAHPEIVHSLVTVEVNR